MDMLWKRRSAVFCLGFVYAGFACALLTLPERIAVLAASALAVLLSLLPLRMPDAPRRLARLIGAAALAGAALCTLYADGIAGSAVRHYADIEAEIRGTVVSREYVSSYAAGYIVRVQPEAGLPYRILLDTADTALTPGDTIECAASFSAFAENSGGFAERRYYNSRGVLLRAEAESVLRLGHASAGIRGAFACLNETMSAFLRAKLGREGAALPAALLLGDRSLLPDTLTRDFRRLGVSHLLAISGFHFTALLGMLEAALRPLIRRKKARALILLPAAVFYMLLCGMTESVVRAGLMLLLAYGGLLFERQSDMPTSLGVAALLICAVSPSSFYSVGLQLSVTAVLALGCLSHLSRLLTPDGCTHRRRILVRLGMAALLPAAVQLALLPMLCLYFGEASLLAPLASLILTLPVEAILLLTPFVFLFSGAAPLCAISRLLADAVAAVSGYLAAPAWVTVSLSLPLAPLFACALSASIGSLALCRRARRAYLTLAVSAALLAVFAGYIAFCAAADAQVCRVISLGVKKNDMLLVQSDGKTVLCDMSDGSYAPLRAAYAAAQKRRATELAAVLLTHLHRRHLASFSRLSEAVYVRALILPEPVTDAERDIRDSLLACARQRGIPVLTYAAGESVLIGEAEITPQRAYLARSTHPALALRVRTPHGSLSYLGASFAESGLDAGAPPDVLILGAHGPVDKREYTLSAGYAPDTILVRENGKKYAVLPPGADVREAEDGAAAEFVFSDASAHAEIHVQRGDGLKQQDDRDPKHEFDVAGLMADEEHRQKHSGGAAERAEQKQRSLRRPARAGTLSAALIGDRDRRRHDRYTYEIGGDHPEQSVAVRAEKCAHRYFPDSRCAISSQRSL